MKRELRNSIYSLDRERQSVNRTSYLNADSFARSRDNCAVTKGNEMYIRRKVSDSSDEYIIPTIRYVNFSTSTFSLALVSINYRSERDKSAV